MSTSIVTLYTTVADGGGMVMFVLANGKLLKEEEEEVVVRFEYLGSKVEMDGSIKAKFKSRIDDRGNM